MWRPRALPFLDWRLKTFECLKPRSNGRSRSMDFWQVLNFVQQILAGREAHVVEDSWGKRAVLAPEGECSLQRCGPTGQNGERDTIPGTSYRESETVGACTRGLSVPDERGHYM